jgi:hypothetical protein
MLNKNKKDFFMAHSIFLRILFNLRNKLPAFFIFAYSKSKLKSMRDSFCVGAAKVWELSFLSRVTSSRFRLTAKILNLSKTIILMNKIRIFVCIQIRNCFRASGIGSIFFNLDSFLKGANLLKVILAIIISTVFSYLFLRRFISAGYYLIDVFLYKEKDK